MRSVTIEYEGKYYKFACGESIFETIKMLFQGYRLHETMVGWCLMKTIINPDNK